MDNTTITITEKEKKELLRLAQSAIASGKKESFILPLSQTPLLDQVYNLFVSIHLNNKLKACMGTLNASNPIHKEVQKQARQAAYHDPRFKPLPFSEYLYGSIEINIMSPRQEISHYQNIIIGQHGIILNYLDKRAVFLPQIPIQEGWGIEQTLSQLCIKAGIPIQTWKKESCQFEIFKSYCFSARMERIYD